jgi:hypothetical protein
MVLLGGAIGIISWQLKRLLTQATENNSELIKLRIILTGETGENGIKGRVEAIEKGCTAIATARRNASFSGGSGRPASVISSRASTRNSKRRRSTSHRCADRRTVRDARLLDRGAPPLVGDAQGPEGDPRRRARQARGVGAQRRHVREVPARHRQRPGRLLVPLLPHVGRAAGRRGDGRSPPGLRHRHRPCEQLRRSRASAGS